FPVPISSGLPGACGLEHTSRLLQVTVSLVFAASGTIRAVLHHGGEIPHLLSVMQFHGTHWRNGLASHSSCTAMHNRRTPRPSSVDHYSGRLPWPQPVSQGQGWPEACLRHG